MDKNKKSDRQDKFPITTLYPSILLYVITIRRSTSEYFSIKGCSLHLYNHVIKCHDTRDDMSAIPSMSRHSNNNMPGDVFNVHTDLPIDAKLFTCEICTYNIKHFFRHTPYCARSACIGSPWIEFTLIDFSQKVVRELHQDFNKQTYNRQTTSHQGSFYMTISDHRNGLASTIDFKCNREKQDNCLSNHYFTLHLPEKTKHHSSETRYTSMKWGSP